MRYPSLFRSCVLLLLCSATLHAQNDKALLRELAEENKKSVDALALYPPETRLAIFEAAKFPEVLIKMDNTRKKTAAAFRNLIEDFPRASQTIFYDMARYPGLFQQLVEKRESPSAIREVLKQLPEKEQDDAFDLVQNQGRTFMKINELDQTARNTFEDLITGYPAPAKTAFRQLVELPEVLAILNEDLRFTVLVGDVYRADPDWVIHKTDSLNRVVARVHAQELDEWKKDIESDPEAQKELESASHEYASEFGYPIDVYTHDDLYVGGFYPEYPPVVAYPYTWWLGYPWWYPTPCWRPYPWWYDGGFYYSNHHFVVVYMPSWYFMDWYFNHPQHHYHYSHLSSHFVHHYYGHRGSGTSISEGVGEWHDRNRTIISDEMLKDNNRLPERMKEYGKFEEGLQTYNTRNPKSPVTKEEYLEKNARKYPEMDRSKTQAAAEAKTMRENPQTRPSDWAPRKEPAPVIPKTEPTRKPSTPPAQKPATERPPRIQTPPTQQPAQKPNTDKPRNPPTQVRPAEDPKDYHRQKWEETKRTETQRQPSPAPAPRTLPQKSAPKTKDRGGRKN